MKKLTSIVLACACLLSACQISSPAQISTQSILKADSLVVAAFHTMAWDGQYLWQYIKEDKQTRLLAQDLRSQKARNLILSESPLPFHKGATYGRNHLWFLDEHNTLFQFSKAGALVKTLRLKDMPALGGAEEITWYGDQSQEQLWVLHKTFLDSEGKTQPARFYQIDPDTGTILKTVEVNDQGFYSFAHQNLTAHKGAFYVVRTHIFSAANNRVYRVDMQSGEVKSAPLNRILTGMPSIFFDQNQLYGVELVDLTKDCGSACKGTLLHLPLP
ncbi:MAG: hypothetical protein AB7I41_16260 [Candidatus Sericytochromatia bacterium]